MQSIKFVRYLFLGMLLGIHCQVRAAGSAAGTLLTVSENVAGLTEPENPLKGFWRNTWLCRKKDRQSIQTPYVHYKYYGDDDMISFTVRYDDRGDMNLTFQGRYMTYRYLSESAIEEAREEQEIEMQDNDHFKLTWIDWATPLETVFEEGWERTTLPQKLARAWAEAYHGAKDSKFAGCWKLKAVRNPSTEEMVSVNYKYYKLYGGDCFFTFVSQKNGSAKTSFSGKLGTFRVFSDYLIEERGGHNGVRWFDDNNFEMTWFDGKNARIELWERVAFPSEYSRILEQFDKYVMEVFTTDENPVEQHTSEVVEQPDILPQYPGGLNNLMRYLSQNIIYPESCKKEKIEGHVIVSFVVGKDGKATDFSIVKSPDERLGQEAVRVLNGMSRWSPGRKDGECVPVKMTLPVFFRLNGDNQDKK